MFRRILESGPVDLESLQLAYPPRVTPEFVLKNGWCPPPESKPDLPFQVCAPVYAVIHEISHLLGMVAHPGAISCLWSSTR